MVRITAEVKGYIQEKIDEFAASIDKTIFLQIKDIMNKYFGEENNQIIKPDTSVAERYIRSNISECTIEKLKRLEASDPSRIRYMWGHLKVYIRFPEVTIVNGHEGTSHKIKDLWIRFNIREKGQISNLCGNRSTLSFQEALSGYLHSHLPGISPCTNLLSPPKFDSFCLGSGEINQVIQFLDADGFDPINFTLFCLHLKNFVEWESIDGRPHMHYENITRSTRSNASSTQSPTNLVSNTLTAAINIIKKHMSYIDIGRIRQVIVPFIINDEVTITQNEELEIFLGNIIRQLSNDELSRVGVSNVTSLLAKKDADGKFIHPDRRRNSTQIVEPTEPIFEFKGKPVHLKIEGLQQLLNNEPENLNTNVYANPQISREFCKSFSADFSEVCYRNQNAIKENSLKNLLQTTGPNLLAVC